MPEIATAVTALKPGEFTARVLPPEEWAARRAELGHYPDLPDPQWSLLIIVEDHEGKIVASWQAINTVHLEGLHLAPAARHNPSVVTMLLGGMFNALAEGQVSGVLTIAQDASILAMATKFGFAVVPGTLLQLDLRKGY